MAEDAAFALDAAKRCDVSVQEIDFVDGLETYPVLQTGSHGLTYTRPAQRET